MTSDILYRRLAEAPLIEALGDSPVVLIHGPRQCGKTTLARLVGEHRGYDYFSFDDEVLLASATADPLGFVDRLPDRTILDEVQRVPGLFTAIKTTVDRDRRPGRFLLTGSANVLLVPQLADSLTGRMEILPLHPLSQTELAGHRPGFLDVLFEGDFAPGRTERLRSELPERIANGGYPPALTRESARRRAAWYRNYVETLVQRDIRELARIQALDVLPRLLEAAAGQTAHLFNLSDLAGPFRVSRPTVGDYVALLERVFLLERLPPWHTNRLRRLVKTPKLHLCDTGVACALLGMSPDLLYEDRHALGQLLETFVVQELRRQASGFDGDLRFYHFRDRVGAEVDLVLVRDAHTLAGVEVKASATVTAADFRGLRKLASAAGDCWAGGAVLYDGETTAGFGDRLHAVPIRRLWEARVSSA